MKLTLESLKSENFGWHELPGGQHIRSNEFPGNYDDVVYHKNQSTLQSYYEIFRHFTPESIMEIGVKEGGSLALWHGLFGCTVVGIDHDINQISPAFRSYQRRETCDIGKQDIVVIHATCFDVSKIIKLTDPYFPEGIDIVIDDGPHTIEATIVSFEAHWNRVRSGGKYIIEDWKALHPTHVEELLDVLDHVAIDDGTAITYPNFIVVHKKVTGK